MHPLSRPRYLCRRLWARLFLSCVHRRGLEVSSFHISCCEDVSDIETLLVDSALSLSSNFRLSTSVVRAAISSSRNFRLCFPQAFKRLTRFRSRKVSLLRSLKSRKLHDHERYVSFLLPNTNNHRKCSGGTCRHSNLFIRILRIRDDKRKITHHRSTFTWHWY